MLSYLNLGLFRVKKIWDSLLEIYLRGYKLVGLSLRRKILNLYYSYSKEDEKSTSLVAKEGLKEKAAMAIEAITSDPENAWVVFAYGGLGVAILIDAC
ncbi:hypothetical protein IFM89_012593 [Coptis chinensis]|uniref:Uncharacterized protein n=1 Tax=Coptis chinensis TaxID=261450 RepID=A0A835ILY7_9MAGN|nr:hypothetical protein IFM89_012593 [Coptis chinensis]